MTGNQNKTNITIPSQTHKHSHTQTHNDQIRASRDNIPVVSEGGGAGEAAAAHRATVRFDWRVYGEMVAEVVLVRESLAADVAGKGLVLDVGFPETDNIVGITNCGNFLSTRCSVFLINI